MFTIHQLVEQQANLTPSAIALVGEDKQLTYHQLNSKANQLANHLRSLGVKKETLVGIYVERSLETVVGMLGVLKAGGAYVTIDNSYPPEYLQYVLLDTKLSVLLTQDKLVESIPDHEGHIIRLDKDWQEIAKQSETTPANIVEPNNLAYITYTSGTTGGPKGVMLTHQGVCQCWRWFQDSFPLNQNDKVMLKTGLGIDISSRWESFWPLMSGACVVVAKPDGHKDNAYLVELIKREQITMLYFIPTILRLFLDEPGVETCTSLKRVFCGGGALHFTLKENFFGRLSNCELIEVYGSSESILASYWHCKPGGNLEDDSLTRAIPGVSMYILNEQLEWVKPGETGEIYIGSEFVGRGYLNRPQLNAERFISNPFVNDTYPQLYRSKDLARLLPNGIFKLIGRLDRMVKVSGYSIEVEEVEAKLNEHPKVKQAAIAVSKDISGDNNLLAYVVSEELQQESAVQMAAQLRNFLHTKLPEYMIPSSFICLEQFPLLPNGKIDAESLPKPDVLRPALAQEFVAPRNSIEEELAKLWVKVLKVEPIGVYDNFYELGGQSLRGMRLLARVRNFFKVDFPICKFLEEPTVAGMAKTIESSLNSDRIKIECSAAKN